MTSSPNKEVMETSHITFDADFKTFRLTTGNSLYAFCISPELTLEHLYWGKSLQEGYDLRYLSQSCRMAHFNTVEAAPPSFDGKIVMEADTLEEIQKTWKENRTKWSSSKTEGEIDYFRKKRLENYSWRVMSKIAQSDLRSISGEIGRPRRKTYGNISISAETKESMKGLSAISPQKGAMRRRSISHPAQVSFQTITEDEPMIDPGMGSSVDFYDLSMVAKSITELPSPTSLKIPSPSNRIINSRTRGKLRHHTDVQTFERQLGKVGKGMLCVEYNDHGTGDFRSPSFIVVDNFNGSAISPLRYRSHKIYKGKLTMPDKMPSIRCMSPNEASTLVITLVDTMSGLEVDLVYVTMHDYNCITRRAVFRNNDKRQRNDSSVGSSKVIQKASSVTIDFECSALPYHMIQLSGSWARERYVVESKLQIGMHSFGSTKGVSSHHQNPFAVITQGPPSETLGEVKAFSLIYSGNFLVEAEVNEMDRLRFNMGIHPMGMQWYLKQAGTFATPEAVLVRSSEGIGGVSRSLHRLFLDRLIPRNWSDEDPPILLNSWEAKYFHVTHDNIIEMTRQASAVGFNLIVLDDGWFGRRDDDKTGLGDWIANLDKFPTGMKGLAEEINKLGCKFGLWFEPEMVSEDSMLFTSHPDWYLHVPGRPRQMGRNQMVLDLSREDVRDYLFHSLSTILENANIEYIKWDMNRPLTEVYSAAAGSGEVWQAEIGHRYVLGVYELQERVITTFPHILLENCASGGGRFDPGMLYYSPQIWCSDNTDAIVRMRIQYGTSYAYPARTVGAHVSTVPNHLTGNTTRLRTRGFVAMSGTFGYELDISTVSAADKITFRKQIDFYRSIAPCVRWGDLYRIWDPFKMNLASWMFVSRDKSQAVVFAFSVNSDHWSNLVPRLQLQGLLADAEYEVTEPFPNNITQSSGSAMIIETEVPVYQLGIASVILTGDILMNGGLPLKFYTLDDSLVFVLNRIDKNQHRVTRFLDRNVQLPSALSHSIQQCM